MRRDGFGIGFGAVVLRPLWNRHRLDVDAGSASSSDMVPRNRSRLTRSSGIDFLRSMAVAASRRCAQREVIVQEDRVNRSVFGGTMSLERRVSGVDIKWLSVSTAVSRPQRRKPMPKPFGGASLVHRRGRPVHSGIGTGAFESEMRDAAWTGNASLWRHGAQLHERRSCKRNRREAMRYSAEADARSWAAMQELFSETLNNLFISQLAKVAHSPRRRTMSELSSSLPGVSFWPRRPPRSSRPRPSRVPSALPQQLAAATTAPDDSIVPSMSMCRSGSCRPPPASGGHPWPERELVTDQSQGVKLATMQSLVRYWRRLRLAEDGGKADALRQFVTRSTGSTFISFTFARRMKMRCRSSVTHGWPGSSSSS